MLYTMLSEDAAAVRSSSRLTAVDFDAQVHLVLCEELKMLYVALTRARKRAFLFDSSLERRAPLFDYLAALGVAEQGLERQLSATARKQPKNSVADWQQRAANFEQNKLWTKAEECFLRAGETARALHAGGHRLAAEVKDAQGKVAKAMKLRSAATAFLTAAVKEVSGRAERSFTKAAFCFYSAAKHGGGLESRCFIDTANVVAQGLGKHQEAAACYYVGAISCTGASRERDEYFSRAADMLASPRCADFAERPAALHALRQLAQGGSTADHTDLASALRVDQLENWLRDQYTGVVS